MITLRQERPTDVEAREALLDEAFGDTRARKTSQRLRDGRLPAEGLSLIAADGRRVIGTARLWNVTCGGARPALLLGPVAVESSCRNRGIGAALVRRALARGAPARPWRGHPGRRCALLQPLRLRGRESRRPQAARPVRAPPPARARTRSRRARRRRWARARRPDARRNCRRPAPPSKIDRFSWTQRRNLRRCPSVCAPRRISPKDGWRL